MINWMVEREGLKFNPNPTRILFSIYTLSFTLSLSYYTHTIQLYK
jgi:hypothetical protein